MSLTAEHSPKFIRRFDGPDAGSGIVCFRFRQLVVALGCSYRCGFCFLQASPPFVHRPEWLNGLVYCNVDDMLREVDVWLAGSTPKMIIAGELQDGLVFDTAYQKVTGKPLTHWLIPRFAAQSRHKLIFSHQIHFDRARAGAAASPKVVSPRIPTVPSCDYVDDVRCQAVKR
jgi:hypothetical protein